MWLILLIIVAVIVIYANRNKFSRWLYGENNLNAPIKTQYKAKSSSKSKIMCPYLDTYKRECKLQNPQHWESFTSVLWSSADEAIDIFCSNPEHWYDCSTPKVYKKEAGVYLNGDN